jgi:hypothetical protein
MFSPPFASAKAGDGFPFRHYYGQDENFGKLNGKK